MRDQSFNDITTGMMKAHHLLTEFNKRRRFGPPSKPKFSYEKIGTVVHAKRCLKKHERAHLNAVLKQLKSVDTTQDDRIKDLLNELNSLPVTFVPIKRETRVDYSKSYPNPGVVFA